MFCQHIYNIIHDVVGVVTLSHPDSRDIPPTNEPSIMKAQLQQESLHKMSKGHPA